MADINVAAKQQFEQAGIRVEVQKDEKHWKLHYEHLVINYWPSTGSCFVFAKSFKAHPGALIKAIKGGRIRLPDGSDHGECRNCNDPIYWLKSSKSGKWLPVDPSGESHFVTCPGRDQFTRRQSA